MGDRVEKFPTLPGSVWVAVIALLNAMAVAVPQMFEGADWLPIAVGGLNVALMAAKYFQVRSAAQKVQPPGDMPEGIAAASMLQPNQEKSRMSQFLWG